MYKIAKISKNSENCENDPQIPINTYGIIAIFAPGRKSYFLCENSDFYVKQQKFCQNQKSCENAWISVNSENM